MKFVGMRGKILTAFAVLGAVALTGAPAQAQYVQQWGDEFNGAAGAAPNPLYWTYDTGNNFGNGELDWATTDRANSYIDGNGNLVIKTIDNGPGANPQYTSAHLKTEGLVPVGPYGQVEARIQTPATTGIGEAFWALGWNYPEVGWPACGEIDMMESHGTKADQSNGTIHAPAYADYGISAPYVNSQPLNLDFHTYGMYWAPYHIQFYVDGNIYSDLDPTKMASHVTWPFNQPIYVINGVGVGGIVAGPPDATSVFPTYEYTDYIHWNTWATGAPSAPSNLSGTANSNSVALTWNASSTPGATYNVYINSKDSFTAGDLSTLEAWAVNGTSITAYDLEPGTTYYFQVRAQNQGGESTPTNTFQITTSPRGNSGPVYINCGGFTIGNYMRDLPTNPLCTAGNPASNSFPPTYDLSAVPNPAPNNVYDSYRWARAAYGINDLNPNTLYTVRLHFCENQFGNVNGRVFNVFVNGNPVLKNLDVYATAGALDKAITYTYTAMSDANGNIQVDTTQGTHDQPEINAIDVVPSAGPNNLPVAPTNLVASTISTNQIGLTWDNVSGATSYNVFRSLSPSFTPSASTYAETVTNTSVTDNVLYTGTTYYYKVCAVNAAGQGGESNIAHATTQSSTTGVIAAVNCGGGADGLYAVDQDFSNGTTNTFGSAIDMSGVSGPNLPSQNVMKTDREGNFGYTFTDLQPGRPVGVTLYFMENYFTTAGSRLFNVTLNNNQVLSGFDIEATSGAKLKAVAKTFTTYVDQNGQINLSFYPTKDNAECSAILLTVGPNIPPPAAPQAVAGDLASGATMVSWQNNDISITGFNIFRGTTPGGEGTTPYVSGFTGTNFMDTNVTNGVTYYYKVNAVNYSGTSPMSTETSAIPGPWPVPGIVQAENFDIGGEGVGYHNDVNTNWGGFYRTNEAVAIEQCQDLGGGFDVGYTGANKWIAYTVDVAQAGSYTVTFRVSGFGGGPIHIEDAAGNNLTGEVSTPSFNGWQSWGNVSATLNLPAGVQTLKFVEEGGGYNFNCMTFAYNGASSTPPVPSLTGYAGDATALLAWHSIAGATSYNLYRGTISGGETLLVSGLASTTYPDNGLVDGTTYYYQVAAVNNVGISSISNEVAVTPVPPVASAPTELTATAGSAQATLSWTASTGATSYAIYRGTTPGGESATPIGSATATTFKNTGLTNGTTYHYTVAAVNAGGTSPSSNEASATPNPPPPAPTGLVGTGGNTVASLTWNAVSGSTSYTVYRSTAPGGELAPAIKTGLTSTSFTDTGLTNGATYYYTVTDTTGVGVESAMSNAADATAQAVTGVGGIAVNCGGAAAAPFVADTDFTGGGTQTVGNAIDTSLLTGTIPPQAALKSNRYGNCTYVVPGLTPSGSYSVTLYFAEEYWSTAGSRVFNVTIDGAQVLTNFDIVAQAGTNYKAVQQTFTTTADASGQVTITLSTVRDNAMVNAIVIGGLTAGGSTPPSTPTGLTATGGDSQVGLTWTAVDGATSYNVYRSTTPGGEGATPLTSSTTASYTDTAVTNGTTYYYKVTAVSGTGASAQSTEASAMPVPPSPPISSITVAPARVIGGVGATVTVTLSAAAPVGGTVVTLSSGNAAAGFGAATVTVPQGSTTATASVSTNPVTTNTDVVLSAVAGVTKTCHLTVLAPILQKVQVLPTKVLGGSGPQTGTVTMPGPVAAPTTVMLRSSNADATVPATVTVPTGASTATFTCTTKTVTATETATIIAGLGPTTTSCSITIKPN